MINGYPNVVLYLINQGYFRYLSREELETPLESPKFLKTELKSILKRITEAI